MFKKDIHHAIPLEIEVLGSCLLENTGFSRVFGIIEEETFYNSNHKIIFGVMSEMFSANLPITLLSVTDYLIRRKGISQIGGNNTAYFICNLTNKIVSTAHLEYYSLILKQMWIDREIITLTSSGINGDTREEIYKLQARLTELSSINFTSDWKDMDELMVGLYKHQDEMETSGGMGTLTGIPTIDNNYGGLFPGQLIIIGARPSVGKSALVGQIAMNMARNNTRVGFISLEMSDNEIAGRMAAADTNIPFNTIYRHLHRDQELRDGFYRHVNSTTANLPISVSDATGLNIEDIRAKAYKLKHKHGDLGCLILDYLQLVEGDSHSSRTRENEISKISRNCKIIAKELQIPFIVPCQLNREVDKRTGKNRYPQLSDFRESGAIEQDADVAMFLHSDYKSGHITDENGQSTEGQADLVIRKWRNGDANIIIPLNFDGPRMICTEAKRSNFVSHGNRSNNDNEDNPF